MEELKKLEQVQKVLSLMQSHRITSSSHLPDPESDRFLASLVLLLMQPCGELGFEEKCQLVCDNVPKLSTLFLEEVSASLLGEDKDKGLDMLPDKIKDICSLKADFNDEAMVGLDAMQRANSTLEDFDDVLENNFNILRMFVRIYGPSAAPTMLARYITEGEEKYIRLLHGLDPDLSHKYQARCEEATREGGKGSGPPLGTWNIPTIITDEELYRSNITAMSP